MRTVGGELVCGVIFPEPAAGPRLALEWAPRVHRAALLVALMLAALMPAFVKGRNGEQVAAKLTVAASAHWTQFANQFALALACLPLSAGGTWIPLLSGDLDTRLAQSSKALRHTMRSTVCAGCVKYACSSIRLRWMIPTMLEAVKGMVVVS